MGNSRNKKSRSHLNAEIYSDKQKQNKTHKIVITAIYIYIFNGSMSIGDQNIKQTLRDDEVTA